MSNHSDRWPPKFDGWSGKSKPPDYDETYTREFTWKETGRLFGSKKSITLDLPVDIYEYCTNRARVPEYGGYISDPLQQPMLESILNEIQDTVDGGGKIFESVINFVQSLEYTRDTEDTGHRVYPKYPIETLVHRRGDCEDGTILLGALLRNRGYDVVPLVLPTKHHMLLGVSVDDWNGSGIKYDGQEYFPIETTDTGWKLGQIPDQYQNAPIEFHNVANLPILVHEWEAVPADENEIDITLSVANFGAGAAKNIKADFVFRRRNEAIETGTILVEDETIPPGRTVESTKTVRLRPTHELQGNCRIVIDGHLHDESVSDWH